MDLNECMYAIRTLVKAKQHEDSLDFFQNKLLFAIVEISEAVDTWKKYGFEGNNRAIAEELIDAIFYILDAYGLMYRDLETPRIMVPTPDAMFEHKLSKNWKRPMKYGRPENALEEKRS